MKISIEELVALDREAHRLEQEKWVNKIADAIKEKGSFTFLEKKSGLNYVVEADGEEGSGDSIEEAIVNAMGL